MKAVPQDKVRNFRNDMYVVSEALRLMQKSNNPQFSTADAAILKNYKGHVDNATKFIPIMGEGRCGAGTRNGHDDWMEADRGYCG